MKKILMLILIMSLPLFAQKTDRLNTAKWSKTAEGQIVFDGSITINELLDVLSSLSVGGDLDITGNMSVDSLVVTSFPALTDSLDARLALGLLGSLLLADNDSTTNVWGDVRFRGLVTLDSSNVIYTDSTYVPTDSTIDMGHLQKIVISNIMETVDSSYNTTDISAYNVVSPKVFINNKSGWHVYEYSSSANQIVVGIDNFGVGDSVKYDLIILEQ